MFLKTSTPLRLEKFSYSREDKTLSAESSDFGPARDGQWWLQRLYDDAADVGIGIRSHHTNKVVYFYLSKELKTPCGEDIGGWEFEPVKPSESPNVHKVVIFND